MSLTIVPTALPCDADPDETTPAAPNPRWDHAAILTLHQREVCVSVFADDRAEFKAKAETTGTGEPYNEITLTTADGTVLHLAMSLPAITKLAAAIARSAER